jgi:hypothetical protein
MAAASPDDARTHQEAQVNARTRADSSRRPGGSATVLTLGAILALLLTGCSSAKKPETAGAPSSSAAPAVASTGEGRPLSSVDPTDPCAVVSEDDVSAAFGGPPIGHHVITDQHKCEYDVDSTNIVPGPQNVFVHVIDATTFTNHRANGQFPNVPGVGDAAYYDGPNGALYLQVGINVYEIDAPFDENTDGNRTDLVALAQRLVTNLG